MFSQPHQPLLDIERVGNAAIVRFIQARLLHNELIEDIDRQLNELIEQEHCRYFVLNFSNVESMTSAMAGKLVGLQRRLKEGGGRLVLCQVGPFLMEIFKILNLFPMLPHFGSEEEALQSFPT